MTAELPVSAAELVISRLRATGDTLAVAESLTAGLVSAELAGVPGATRALRGAITTYATATKHSALGVSAQLLDQRGPVDPEVARAMALGAARLFGASHGLATTGVAGPGPAGGRAAGTVWVTAVSPTDMRARLLQLSGLRQDVRLAASAQALSLMAELLGDEQIR